MPVTLTDKEFNRLPEKKQASLRKLLEEAKTEQQPWKPTKADIKHWTETMNKQGRCVTTLGNSNKLTIYDTKGYIKALEHGRRLGSGQLKRPTNPTPTPAG